MSRNKYPEKTTQKIIDVATDLFVHKGYDNTSCLLYTSDAADEL